MGLNPDCFEYRPGFLGRTEVEELLRCLRDELHWRQPTIKMFGREMPQPRLVAWYGDPGADYRYSGLSLRSRPWHPALERLRDRVQEFSGCRFNSVLANAYRDGRDSMGWHRDDEPELGPAPCIASVSLGATRRLLIRPGPGTRSAGIDLEPGSVLIMRGESQKRYQHALPKTRREVGLRINLTYRWVRSVGAGRSATR